MSTPRTAKLSYPTSIKVEKIRKCLIDQGYMSHYMQVPKGASSSRAERDILELIFKETDPARMIARLGSLMVDNTILEQSEDLNTWMAFGYSVMLELNNRGFDVVKESKRKA